MSFQLQHLLHRITVLQAFELHPMGAGQSHFICHFHWNLDILPPLFKHHNALVRTIRDTSRPRICQAVQLVARCLYGTLDASNHLHVTVFLANPQSLLVLPDNEDIDQGNCYQKSR